MSAYVQGILLQIGLIAAWKVNYTFVQKLNFNIY